MPSQQPLIYTAGENPRGFAATATALQAIIVDPSERILLLNSPSRGQGWQVISGALEAGESILAGTLRETSEECGGDMIVRPLGTVHAETFRYDDNVPYMNSHFYLLAYESGEVVPGDDMTGSDFRWWRVEELEAEQPRFHPSTRMELLKRAVDLYRLWHREPPSWLQPDLTPASGQ